MANEPFFSKIAVPTGPSPGNRAARRRQWCHHNHHGQTQTCVRVRTRGRSHFHFIVLGQGARKGLTAGRLKATTKSSSGYTAALARYTATTVVADRTVYAAAAV